MALRSHNLFFALQPPVEVRAAVSLLKRGVCRELKSVGHHVRAEKFHLSLRSLGDHENVPHQLVASAATALEKVTIPPFVVGLNRMQGWKGRAGRQPLVLTGDEGVAEFNVLRRQVSSCLTETGIVAPSKRSGVPHMTLFYGNVLGFDGVIAPVRWHVREVVLIDSHVGENRHVVLHRHTLH